MMPRSKFREVVGAQLSVERRLRGSFCRATRKRCDKFVDGSTNSDVKNQLANLGAELLALRVRDLYT
jgi:hypothetical protein